MTSTSNPRSKMLYQFWFANRRGLRFDRGFKKEKTISILGYIHDAHTKISGNYESFFWTPLREGATLFISYTKYQTNSLPQPYDTKCVNYRERNFESKAHCFESCVVNMSIGMFHKFPLLLSNAYYRLDYEIDFKRNMTQIKLLRRMCDELCGDDDCKHNSYSVSVDLSKRNQTSDLEPFFLKYPKVEREVDFLRRPKVYCATFRVIKYRRLPPPFQTKCVTRDSRSQQECLNDCLVEEYKNKRDPRDYPYQVPQNLSQWKRYSKDTADEFIRLALETKCNILCPNECQVRYVTHERSPPSPAFRRAKIVLFAPHDLTIVITYSAKLTLLDLIYFLTNGAGFWLSFAPVNLLLSKAIMKRLPGSHTRRRQVSLLNNRQNQTNGQRTAQQDWQQARRRLMLQNENIAFLRRHGLL